MLGLAVVREAYLAEQVDAEQGKNDNPQGNKSFTVENVPAVGEVGNREEFQGKGQFEEGQYHLDRVEPATRARQRLQHRGENGKQGKGNGQSQSEAEHTDGRPMATPIEAACTSRVPMMGPVQENDTRARVKAMKKILNSPLVESALLSSFVVHEAGRVSSKAPKKEMANTTSRAKNKMLKTAFVARLLRALAPKMAVMSRPRPT